MEYFSLKNGVKLPKIGYGTYKIPPDITKECVLNALEVGYRHIDTATFYHNESEIGDAIKESEINRADIFLTTKIWTTSNTYDKAKESMERSLEALKTDYLDMVLIHWPTPNNSEVWYAMEEMYDKGLVKVLGVSNFKEHHIDELLESARIRPMVEQVELHPYFQQNPLREYCKKLDIQVEAWSPLLRGGLFFDPTLDRIANKHERSIAEVVLRFLSSEGISVIPKTVDRAKMEENFNIFDFELDADDMEVIRSLNKNIRYYRDPDRHGF